VAGDAMAKRAPVAALHAGTVHPGKYLVLVSGEVAAVEEALAPGAWRPELRWSTSSSCRRSIRR
jgi:microcompartment protein CcmL/EutN